MDDDDLDVFPSNRIRAIDVGITALAVTATTAKAVSDGLDALVRLLCQHANYKNDQERFANAIRADLENLPTTEES